MKNLSLLIVVTVVVVVYGVLFSIQPALISPDELSYKFFSGQLARKGSIFYDPPGDRVMGQKGFIPRKFHYNVRGEVVPRKPPGLILVWALFQKLAGERFSPAVFPLLVGAALFLFYRFSRHIFPERGLRLASLLLLASAPVFLLRSHAYSPTMLNLVIFFSLLLLLQQLLEQGRWYHYLCAGLMAGCLIWVRPTSSLIWVPLGVCLLAERRRLKTSGLIWLGAGGLSVLALYLAYNRLVFGNFLASGYTVPLLDPEDGSVSGGVKGFFRIVEFHPEIWFLHLISTPLAFSLAFPPLVLSLAGFWMMGREVFPRRWLYFWVILAAVFIAFFSNFETYGFYSREVSLRSSFLRYCFPVLVFLPLGAAFFLSKLGRFFPGALAIVVAFNLVIAVFAPLGLLDSFLLGSYYRQVKNFILENSDDRSVILSSYWDKLAFPERLVFPDIRNKNGKFVPKLVSLIQSKGYEALYIDHEYDRDVFQPLLEGREKELTVGPSRLPFLLEIVPPPSGIYPVAIYKLELTRKARKF